MWVVLPLISFPEPRICLTKPRNRAVLHPERWINPRYPARFEISSSFCTTQQPRMAVGFLFFYSSYLPFCEGFTPREHNQTRYLPKSVRQIAQYLLDGLNEGHPPRFYILYTRVSYSFKDFLQKQPKIVQKTIDNLRGMCYHCIVINKQ